MAGGRKPTLRGCGALLSKVAQSLAFQKLCGSSGSAALNNNDMKTLGGVLAHIE